MFSGSFFSGLKQIAILTCIAWVALGVAATADQRIAFERGEAVYITNVDASIIRKVADGIFPAISPNAKSVALTVVNNTNGAYRRHIAMIDIPSANTRTLTDIQSDNAYCATWSPAGNWLAFTMLTDGLWNLALINADGTGFKIIKKGDADKVTFFSPCSAADGKSLFCHDTTNIYRIALDGSVIGEWKIRKIVPNGGMSGDGRINVSPDGVRLLLSIDMDEEYTRKDWDGPVPALWSFDLATQTAVRLTSRNLFAWDGCWLDNANVLFVTQRVGQKQTAIYRTNGKNLKRLIDDGRRPSVSRPTPGER